MKTVLKYFTYIAMSSISISNVSIASDESLHSLDLSSSGEHDIPHRHLHGSCIDITPAELTQILRNADLNSPFYRGQINNTYKSRIYVKSVFFREPKLKLRNGLTIQKVELKPQQSTFPECTYWITYSDNTHNIFKFELEDISN